MCFFFFTCTVFLTRLNRHRRVNVFFILQKLSGQNLVLTCPCKMAETQRCRMLWATNCTKSLSLCTCTSSSCFLSQNCCILVMSVVYRVKVVLMCAGHVSVTKRWDFLYVKRDSDRRQRYANSVWTQLLLNWKLVDDMFVCVSVCRNI